MTSPIEHRAPDSVGSCCAHSCQHMDSFFPFIFISIALPSSLIPPSLPLPIPTHASLPFPLLR
ncbi:hypothetical protein E2C01_064259 [Portunus trituberculatus]|uniref:Uncharacterized protein n=1 Tax=Portunus trituberculatus TaxID=210409 RepID=A0A5B7HNA2_PORTR|nr:hypothetical protein [Portunus trituberculatus]